jgi:uncharacterized protein (DUF2141 family)
MKNIWKYSFVVPIFLCIVNPSLAEDDNLSLIVKVSGAIPDKGQAIFSLFTSSKDYLKQPAISKIKPVNNKGEAIFSLTPLETGIYAISIIYDENNDGKLNTNFIGIPTEHIGFSNNATGVFGPPSFDDTALIFKESQDMHITFGKASD